MARISYVGQGTNFRKLLNHSPQVAAAYWELRKALNEGVLSPKLRMLSFLSSDVANGCRY
ncbi:MAG TPA: hypothetical protein VFC31_05430 [Candidatus Limnocylindria bacterium]|nr:hypothetical protein [Candidatus Limnocylindria bacterium]